jgi:hypothetical protein
MRYRCQATDLRDATTRLRSWDVRQYIMDLASRNVRLRDFVRYVPLAMFNHAMRLLGQRYSYPSIRGSAGRSTPVESLGLQAGELVEVRTRDEVVRTLNDEQKNRGLHFDVEMLPFCGKRFRVLRRVERIIDEKSGRMLRLPNDCIILDGATCGGCLSRDRLFCPRGIYPYWREIWLRRVGDTEEGADTRRKGSSAPTADMACRG